MKGCTKLMDVTRAFYLSNCTCELFLFGVHVLLICTCFTRLQKGCGIKHQFSKTPSQFLQKQIAEMQEE